MRPLVRNLENLWHVSFIDLVILPYSWLFLDESTLKMHSWRFIAEFLKSFMYWRKILSSFFQLLYAISTFRLFINENSKVNVTYSVFVIAALKSLNLSQRQ